MPASRPTSRLPRTVIGLGLVSLFTDLSSEMIYPLLPLFLTTVLGAGAVALGIIEGIAESTAALLKVVSGWWADRAQRRKPFVFIGYGLSGLARPLIGLAGAWPFVLAMRFLDRVGKGVRTSPRDALIADVTDPAMRGAAFGFHRAMDHGGAVLGPLVAAALLYWMGWSLRAIFLLSAVPAAIVIAIVAFGVREGERATPPLERSAPRGHGRALGSDYRWLLASLVVFTLGNSTDAFLLLRLNEAGLGATALSLLWALHHAVKMAATWWGGRASDRLGRRRLMIAGWGYYGLVYLAFAWFDSPGALIAIFLAYGVYFGLTEPVEKAWVADLAPPSLRGAAFGYYHGAIGLAALPASVLFGLIWKAWGAGAAFGVGAALAWTAAMMLLRLPERRG